MGLNPNSKASKLFSLFVIKQQPITDYWNSARKHCVDCYRQKTFCQIFALILVLCSIPTAPTPTMYLNCFLSLLPAFLDRQVSLQSPHIPICWSFYYIRKHRGGQCETFVCFQFYFHCFILTTWRHLQAMHYCTRAGLSPFRCGILNVSEVFCQ